MKLLSGIWRNQIAAMVGNGHLLSPVYDSECKSAIFGHHGYWMRSPSNVLAHPRPLPPFSKRSFVKYVATAANLMCLCFLKVVLGYITDWGAEQEREGKVITLQVPERTLRR